MKKVMSRFGKYLALGTVAACMLFPTPQASAQEETAKTAPASGDPVRFVLLRPDDDHPFWELFEQVMVSTCFDLGCEMEAKRADWDRYKMIEQAKSLAQEEKKPDMVFFQSFKHNGENIIEELEKMGINGFMVNAGLKPEVSEKMGKPREKFKHWIGQMMPDDYGAGRSVAEALYKTAKEKGYTKGGKVYFAGIEGNSADGASIERMKGLQSVVDEHEDLELLQVVQGKWDPKISKVMTLNLLSRYPDLKIIWAAGDPIAFGVVDAVEEKELPDGAILTGGVDWAPRALEEIEKGRMVGSAGGHFMEGAWATIIAYDYVKGIDFAEKMGTELNSEMFFLSKDNLQDYMSRFGNGNFEAVDFRKLSKFHTPEIKDYHFNIFDLETE